MLIKEMTYAHSGVDRERRASSKAALRILKGTYRFSHHGKVVQLPYGNVFPVGDDRYLDLAVEGVGTKVLVAQLTEKYDTVGIDGIAMAVNDVIRSGARPLAVVDNLHTQVSDPTLVKELMKGIVKGAEEAHCIVAGGEIGDVPELIRGLPSKTGFDIVVAAVGEVDKQGLITGNSLRPGDSIIGLRSSGIHSNGVSLARKILFKQWGGKYDPEDIPEGLDRQVADEVLEPTRIYADSLLAATAEVTVKAAVHITGDAYLKFSRLAHSSKKTGFELDNFRPQEIFELIQKTASQLGSKVSDEEMFKTFNMGWGFALIVDKTQLDTALDAMGQTGIQAEKIGQIVETDETIILHKGKKIVVQ